MRKKRGPTNSELEILSVLWNQGPSTVAEIQASVKGSRNSGYTTLLKLLQIMHQKGLVVRDETTRPHRYQARYQPERTQRQILRDLIQKAFHGSASKLVVQALSAKKVSKEELHEIREIIQKMEEEQGNES